MYISSAARAAVFLLATTAAIAAPPDWMRYSRSMVQDAQGNIYVVGTVTRALTGRVPDEILTRALCRYTCHQPPLAAPCSHGFAAKISADGSKVLYATYLEGTASEWASPIGVDASGNLFVYGSTSSPDFPVTGALPFASRILFSTTFSRSHRMAAVFSSATLLRRHTSASAKSFSRRKEPCCWAARRTAPPFRPRLERTSTPGQMSASTVTFWNGTLLRTRSGIDTHRRIGSGSGDQHRARCGRRDLRYRIYHLTGFPVIAGGFLQSGDTFNGVVVNDFIAKLDRTLSTLQFSTIFGGSYHPIPYAVAADASGYVYVVGSGSRDMPVSPGAFETSFSGAFLAKSHKNGARVYLTYLGKGQAGSPGTLAPAPDGSVWIAGTNNYGGVVTTPDALEPTISNPYSMPGYVKRISADGSRQIYGTYVSDFLAATGPGVVLVSEPTNVFRTINLNTIAPPAAPPAIAAIVNAASMGQPGFIAPGEIVSIFGSSIGPDVPSSYRLDAARRISSNLDGLEVLVDGLAAPVLYASKTQINVVVPFALTPITNSASVVVEIQRNGRGTATATAEGVYSLPGIFESEGAGLILNQDGTLNAKDNVAKSGSIISLFATGLGPMSPVPPDGSFAGTPGSKPDLRLQVFVGTSALGPFTPVAADSVTYAGDAPGQVEGVVQINFRLPDGAVFNTVYVKSGSAVSNPVTFWEADRT